MKVAKGVVKLIKREPLVRVRLRPLPTQWADDEAITLVEAAAIFFPDGQPLTLSSLRTAAGSGQLAIARVAGKHLTTPGAVRALLEPVLRQGPLASGNVPTTAPGSSSIEDGKSARAAAKKKLKELRVRSKLTRSRSAAL